MYTGLGYDPEAIIQDADIEMMELQVAANEQANACKGGEHREGTETNRGDIFCLDCWAELS